jgi:hypothetical protein
MPQALRQQLPCTIKDQWLFDRAGAGSNEAPPRRFRHENGEQSAVIRYASSEAHRTQASTLR